MNREFSDSLMIRYSYLTQRVIPKLTPIPSITFNGVSIKDFFLLIKILYICKIKSKYQ
jgi:hypothetical protein